MQRDFSKTLTQAQLKTCEEACRLMVSSGACDMVFTDILKQYAEVFFTLGETEAVRDVLCNNMNVVLKVEERVRGLGSLPSPEEEDEDTI